MKQVIYEENVEGLWNETSGLETKRGHDYLGSREEHSITVGVIMGDENKNMWSYALRICDCDVDWGGAYRMLLRS